MLFELCSGCESVKWTKELASVQQVLHYISRSYNKRDTESVGWYERRINEKVIYTEGLRKKEGVQHVMNRYRERRYMRIRRVGWKMCKEGWGMLLWSVNMRKSSVHEQGKGETKDDKYLEDIYT